MNLGYKDIPVESLADDILEVKDYVQSLAKFIVSCQTPMTIAIQGDWGSGKTSIMNMVRREMGADMLTVWFNTWQYSQFNMGGMMSVSLLHNIIKSIDADTSIVSNVYSAIRNGLGVAARSGVSAVVEKIAGQVNAEKLSNAMSDGSVDSCMEEVIDLKSKMAAFLDKKLKKEGQQRAVIFIDDLDRLPPEKAIELLEVMKIFMDIDAAVFVLAVDYQVVVQGLEKKYGGTIGTEKGRNFFDKIIQLPFTVPIGHYKVEKYVGDLLNKMGIDDASWINLYISLIDSSIGFNPRSVKRLFNSYWLLTDVAERRGLISPADTNTAEKKRLLFAVLCLQMSFPDVYIFLLNQLSDIDQSLIDNLLLEQTYTDDVIPAEIERRAEVVARCADFMESFRDACSSDGDDVLNAGELNNVRQILSFSTITSTVGGGTELTSEKNSRTRLNTIAEFTKMLKQDKKFDEASVRLVQDIYNKLSKAFHDQGREVRFVFTGKGIMTVNIPARNRQRVVLYVRTGKKKLGFWCHGKTEIGRAHV